MRRLVAVPTKNAKGLDDTIADVFARSEYFAIIEVSNGGSIRLVEVIRNEFSKLSSGVGPLVIGMLRSKGVDVVLTPELGFGMKQLISELTIKHIMVRAGTKVKDVVMANIERIRDP